MKAKISFIFTVFLLLPTVSTAELTLEECYELAEKNYPLQKNIDYSRRAGDLEIDNLNAEYFPKVSLFGKAQYQSDVTDINMDLQIPNFNPDFPTMPKDQYQAGININQLIWDGGMIAQMKDIEQAKIKAEQATIESILYGLREKVNGFYFGILLLNKQKEILEASLKNLESNLDAMRSRVDNGVALPAHADILQAEKLKLEQNISQIESNISAARQGLESLIGTEIPEEEQLQMPDYEISISDDVPRSRPEYATFKYKQENLRQASQLSDAKYMPKISAFATGAYGKPGLDMFSEDFKPYYIVGVQASWEFWNRGKNSREKEILKVKRQMIESEESAFTKNLEIASAAYENEIENLQELIEKDRQIIELRQKILRNAESRLRNGVITATEYITEFNEEKKARLNLEKHKIQLNQAGISYMTLFAANK